MMRMNDFGTPFQVNNTDNIFFFFLSFGSIEQRVMAILVEPIARRRLVLKQQWNCMRRQRMERNRRRSA